MNRILNVINFHLFTYLMSDDEMDEWHNYYDVDSNRSVRLSDPRTD